MILEKYLIRFRRGHRMRVKIEIERRRERCNSGDKFKEIEGE